MTAAMCAMVMCMVAMVCGANRMIVHTAPVTVADVVRALPHDPEAFTEGLLLHQGRLFESTGEEGHSSIREIELETGRVLRQRDLDPTHFGEGIAILGDALYELTWRSGRVFVYDWKTFTPQRSMIYAGEGWGLTTDGTSLIMSNGTPEIVWRNPRTFVATRRITVTDGDEPVKGLNELEWIRGELWANIWQSERIARIDPATGRVKAWVDLSGLLAADDRTGREDVMNGIAYDPVSDHVFVTGKWWGKLFELRIDR